MIRIIRNLPDDTKQRILENAGGQCQCNFTHRCVRGVNKASTFVTNLPEDAMIPDESIKVLCKGCIDRKHHHHLAFPPTPVVRLEDLVKRFTPKDSSVGK